jgi:protoporphyrinogen oxidase
MCRGIFAGDIKKLSVKSCLPMLYKLEENSGSIVKGLLFGKSKFFSVSGIKTARCHDLVKHICLKKATYVIFSSIIFPF